jgi:hypothetical protein
MSKAYTDIEQSKKLAEFLPIESADMGWYYSCNPQAARNQMWVGTKPENADIPCWSLAALIDVLPLVETHKQTDGHKIYYYVDLYMKRKGKEIYLSTERHESLVDACYEMIIKLNELKLL